MFKTKFIISTVIFTSFLIITSAIKNKTRVLEKKVSILNAKILYKQKNINETQLDFYYLSSPQEIEKRLQIIGIDIYKPIKHSRIFLNTSDLTDIQTKTSNLNRSNEKEKQKK